MHEILKSQQLVVLQNHGILQRDDLLYFYIVYCILTYMSSSHYIKQRNIIQQKEILQKNKRDNFREFKYGGTEADVLNKTKTIVDLKF